MTEALFAAAIFILACAILATLYCILRNTRPQPEQQFYRRHGPENFK